MKPTTQYRIDTYCLIAFNSMKANLDLWRSKPNDKDVLRGVTRPYYDLVHSLSIPSGYITVNALQEKKRQKLDTLQRPLLFSAIYWKNDHGQCRHLSRRLRKVS